MNLQQFLSTLSCFQLPRMNSYILQAARSCFNQNAVDPTCKMCKKEPEDREHFIARCWSLEHIICYYKQKLVDILNDSNLSVMSDSASDYTGLVSGDSRIWCEEC